jgi:hypothetical protein
MYGVHKTVAGLQIASEEKLIQQVPGGGSLYTTSATFLHDRVSSSLGLGSLVHLPELPLRCERTGDARLLLLPECGLGVGHVGGGSGGPPVGTTSVELGVGAYTSEVS